MAVDENGAGMHFINETSDGVQQSKATTASKRRLVRSQAMIAVRRQQRLDSELHLRLRWTAPKIGIRLEAAKASDSDSVNSEKRESRRTVTRYDFVKDGSAESCNTREKLESETNSSESEAISVEQKVRTQGNHQQSAVAYLQEFAPSISPVVERFGGGRRNPFDTYPIPFDEEVNELMDHYTVVIPYLMYGTKFQAPMQRLLYHLSFDSLAALCAIMALASRHIDSLQGIDESPRSLRHMTAAVGAVNATLRRKVFPCNDALVFAVTLLATIERRLGNASMSKRHWMGMREILAQRGGLKSMNNNRQLKAMILWNDLVFARDQRTADPWAYEWPSLAHNDFESQDTLLAFLEEVEDVSHRVSRQGHTSRAALRIWKQRRKIFSEKSVMHNTLLGEPELKDHQRSLTALACQHSCLIYLGVIFLEFAHQAHEEERFLCAMGVLTEELSKGLSPEHLLARLLMGLTSEDADIANGRAWKVMRLILEVKMLDAQACSNVRHKLWTCISLQIGDEA